MDGLVDFEHHYLLELGGCFWHMGRGYSHSGGVA